MTKYNYQKIEKKWQKEWSESGIYEAEDFSSKPKYYCLIEFPYPSGAGLHVGHLRSHIAIDIVARQKRMNGYNVMYPIGWDAFGLPTENFAIKTKTHPKIVTEDNVKNFTKQIKSYGPSFDWSREINTTDPEYYKWTQWIFLKLFNSFYDEKLDKARPIEKLKIPKNLNEDEKRKYIDDHRIAYEAKMAINWCPSCKIGLANEEVVNDACERCGAPAEKKNMKQWMLRITKYAERLICDLETVDYLDKIKTQQINWIGRSEGAEVEFRIKNFEFRINIFTTRPDTLFGCTYMVLAPEHPMIKNLESRILNLEEIKKYILQAKNKSDLDRTDLAKEKTGVELKGIKAINPANNEEIPIWIADYVLATYGTGAIMAVPAHDERDFEFAKKFGIDIRQVVAPLFVGEGKNKIRKDKKNTKREVVDVIIKHWEKDEYFCLDWCKSKNDWKTFIVGGIEKGENAEEAALREAKEESGYQNMRVVKKIGNTIYSRFFAAHKDVNRRDAKRSCVYIELLDNSFIEPKEKHTKNHEGIWIKKKEIENFINLPEPKIHWDVLQNGEKPFTEYGVAINSGQFNDLETSEFEEQITAWLEKNKFGKKAINYKLRDWIFSRQHYWGEPIPIVKCEKCGNISLSEKDLPLELPNIKNYEPTDTGESPLAKIDQWVNVKCPRCKENAKRETDTMPNWAGSSWYFLRYLDPKNNTEFASPEKLKYWMPIDLYNGGMEHTTLHLLYSRFWHKFLFDLDYVNTPEPYAKRRSHGMILAEDGQKMSKSRGNVVNPDEVIKKYGADTVRLYEMFMGPYGDAIPWNTSSLIGMNRFLQRVWGMQSKVGTQDFVFSSEKKQNIVPDKTRAQNLASLLVATNNQGKLKELRDHLKNFNIISLKEIGKAIEEPEENGKTFAENSLIKAKYYAKKTGYLTIADDSGLCVNALEGRPGVFSSRYAEGDDRKGCEKLIKELENKADRSAYYKSVITLYNPENNEYDQFDGKCEGEILDSLKGNKSFGYAPVFMTKGLNRSNAECSSEERYKYNHRKQAVDKLIRFLNEFLSPVPFGSAQGKTLSQRERDAIQSPATEQALHKTIKKVTEDIDNLKFNTAISSLMIFANEMEKEKEISLIHYSQFLILLSPFAPHIAEELWEMLNKKKSIHLQKWPKFNPELIKEKEIQLVIQINGKLRDQMKVPTDISEEEAKKAALKSEKVQKWIKGKEIRKVIFVKGKLVNVVI